jgi:hypothetical protein
MDILGFSRRLQDTTASRSSEVSMLIIMHRIHHIIHRAVIIYTAIDQQTSQLTRTKTSQRKDNDSVVVLCRKLTLLILQVKFHKNAQQDVIIIDL